MKVHYSERLYIPALAIVGVVLSLLVFISISTYSNLKRERIRSIASAERQAMTLIHAVAAVARAFPDPTEITNHFVDNLILQAGKFEDVSHLYLADSNGKITHRSVPDNHAGFAEAPEHGRQQTAKTIGSGKIRVLPGNKRVFEIAYPFSFFEKKEVDPDGQSSGFIIAAIELHEFEEARKEDLQHAVIMSLIVLALGSGALFFIFVIRKYYLTNRALRQAQDYTRLVIEHMANGLLSVDLEGKIVSYNRLALELLQVKESEVVGKPLNDILDFQSSGIAETLTSRRTILEWEINHPLENGKSIPLSVCATPIITESQNLKGAVIVLRDLSEIKKLEEKVRRTERLAAVGELSAAVAHEIRNPLSSIKGLAQFLGNLLKKSPENENYAKVIVSEVDRINQFVTDLLVLSKPFDAKLEPVNIAELVNHSILLVQNEASSHNITIKTIFSDRIDTVPLDANQMTQALLNLLLNAIQALPEGGKIEVGTIFDSEKNQFTIWIKDNGPGIPDEYQKKIFSPFFTTRESGTGLGLAIVNRIIENHDGEIQIKSPLPDKESGCMVSIRIPIKKENIYIIE